MKKTLSALCLVLLTCGLTAIPAAAEDTVAPSPLLDGLSCTGKADSPTIPLGLPEWLDAAGCCPRTCSVNSDCDASCGPGFGECRFLGTCCSFCLCSLGGTSSFAGGSGEKPDGSDEKPDGSGEKPAEAAFGDLEAAPR